MGPAPSTSPDACGPSSTGAGTGTTSPPPSAWPWRPPCARTTDRTRQRRIAVDDAVQHLHQALHLYGELGDPDGQAQTHIALGIVVERQGRHRTALSHTRQALRLYRTAGDRARQAVALNAVGWDHAQLGEHHQALRHCREALELGRRGCPGPVATAWRA
jgi:tetratricopeptide (TPR) repeat protein